MNVTRSLRAFQRTFQHTFQTYHAPYRISGSSTSTTRAFSTPTLRKHRTSRRTAHQIRSQSTETSAPESCSEDIDTRPAKPLTDRSSTSQSDADAIATRKALSPAYQLWFTCKKCLERSGHTVSKQAYHFGTCVITCPKCKSQHLISDHLKIFSDTKMTMEDIAKQHGEKLRKGRLGADGDVEFYDEEAERIVAKDEAKKREQAEMTERFKENSRQE